MKFIFYIDTPIEVDAEDEEEARLLAMEVVETWNTDTFLLLTVDEDEDTIDAEFTEEL